MKINKDKTMLDNLLSLFKGNNLLTKDFVVVEVNEISGEGLSSYTKENVNDKPLFRNTQVKLKGINNLSGYRVVYIRRVDLKTQWKILDNPIYPKTNLVLSEVKEWLENIIPVPVNSLNYSLGTNTITVTPAPNNLCYRGSLTIKVSTVDTSDSHDIKPGERGGKAGKPIDFPTYPIDHVKENKLPAYPPPTLFEPKDNTLDDDDLGAPEEGNYRDISVYRDFWSEYDKKLHKTITVGSDGGEEETEREVPNPPEHHQPIPSFKIDSGCATTSGIYRYFVPVEASGRIVENKIIGGDVNVEYPVDPTDVLCGRGRAPDQNNRWFWPNTLYRGEWGWDPASQSCTTSASENRWYQWCLESGDSDDVIRGQPGLSFPEGNPLWDRFTPPFIKGDNNEFLYIPYRRYGNGFWLIYLVVLLRDFDTERTDSPD